MVSFPVIILFKPLHLFNSPILIVTEGSCAGNLKWTEPLEEVLPSRNQELNGMLAWANELLVGVLGEELSPSIVVKPQPKMSKNKI